MKNLKSKIIGLGVGTTIGILSLLPQKSVAQSPEKKEKIEVKIGYNALESGLTNKGNLRIRTFEDIKFQYKNINLGFHGLNEWTENLKGYFGRNVLTVGSNNKNWKLAGVFKSDSKGIFDKKYGIRFNLKDKLGADYGWADAVFNQKSGNVTTFLGKSLGSKTSIELFNSIEFPFGKKHSVYTEIQLNKKIKKDLSIYARGEMTGTKYKEVVYLLGITKKF